MSEVGGSAAPSGGGAPAAAPSAPASAPSSPGAGTSSPNPSQPQASPQGQQQAAAPTRTPVLIKHKARIGDGDAATEHEIELDIAEHLAAQKFRFKADSEEHELSYDDVMKRLPLAQGAFKRMATSAEATKAADAKVAAAEQRERRIEAALRDPDQATTLLERALGGEEGFLRAVERYVANKSAERKLTPEQRQQRDEAQRRQAEIDKRDGTLSQREKAIQAREQAVQKMEAERLVQTYRQEWPKALAAEGVKETQGTVRMMARVISDARLSGYEMSAAEAAIQVKEEVAKLLGGLDGSALASAVPGAAQQLQQAQIEQLNATTPGRVSRNQQPPPARKQQEAQPDETWEEFTERRRREADASYHGRLLRQTTRR